MHIHSVSGNQLKILLILTISATAHVGQILFQVIETGDLDVAKEVIFGDFPALDCRPLWSFAVWIGSWGRWREEMERSRLERECAAQG